MRKRKGSVRQTGGGGGAGQAKATPDNQCRYSRLLCSERGGAGCRGGSRVEASEKFVSNQLGRDDTEAGAIESGAWVL